MSQPSVDLLKEQWLNENKVVPFKITGEAFLQGLLDNIKKNLKFDVENRAVSIDTALAVFQSHNLKVELDACGDKNWIKNILQPALQREEADIIAIIIALLVAGSDIVPM